MQTLAQHLAERIRESRQRKGWSGERLGEEMAPDAPIPRQTISHWETGLHVPGLELFAVLCQALGESADYLLFGKRTIPNGGGAPAVKVPAPTRRSARGVTLSHELTKKEFDQRIPRRRSANTKTKTQHGEPRRKRTA